MQNNDYLNTLIDLMSTRNVRKMSGEPKKIFRYVLVAIFINTINAKRVDSMKQEENIGIANFILREPKSSLGFKNSIIKQVQQSMKNNFFHDPKDYGTVIEVNKFFREKLESLKSGKRFWKATEFEKLFSVKDYFNTQSIPIQSYHWIDFNIYHGLIPTYPELITYNDLINSWNLIVEKSKEYQVHNRDRDNDLSLKQLEYEIFSLQRYSYTSCVTFFESYLFYLFYNLKSKNVFEEDEKIQKLYKLKHTKVDDTHILKEIILPKYIINENQKKFEELLDGYEKLNDIRNSIIHTSAFENLSDQSSTMELFMTMDIDFKKLEEAYELVIDFSLFIESLLPESLKVLFWWDRFEKPDFTSRKKIKRTSLYSHLVTPFE